MPPISLFRSFRQRPNDRPQSLLMERESPIEGKGRSTGSLASYPPVDAGIPAVSVEELVEANQPLLRRIKLAYGNDEATFERDLLAAIRRYAAYVHLLPATPDNHFRGPGGLLRMGLEIGFFALQATDSHIFSGPTTITQRRSLEPRWRQATFLAGLCCELHRTLSGLVVTDEAGLEWRPYLEPLHTWLRSGCRKRYFLRWMPNAQETRSLGVFALPHIVPSETISKLADDNDVVVPHMMACISGMAVYRDANVLDQLVRRATALVVDRDLSSSGDRYGQPLLGAHLERYLVDAMRRLASTSSSWQVNGEKSRVWLARDGLYLVWPNAMTDIVALLERDEMRGIPKSAETIYEILLGAGVLVSNDAPNPHWMIQPPSASAGFEAVKLSTPSILLAVLDHAPAPLETLVPKPARTNPSTPRENTLPVPETAMAAANGSMAPSKAEPTSPSLVLLPPARLNPAVKSVFEEIIMEMNNPGGSNRAWTTSLGIFIPIKELSRRSLEPAQALRALRECGMLVLARDGMALTHAQQFGGEQVDGLILHPRFVRGLDPHDFDC